MATRGLFYDDVWLIPRQESGLGSRGEADTSVNFCGRQLRFPILAAPMPDVCDGNMAQELWVNGGFGVIHRFQTIEEQKQEVQKIVSKDSYKTHSPQFGCAIGVTGDYLERFEEIYSAGCHVFCLDVANGYSKVVEKAINELRKRYSVYIIAGNVASKEGFAYLSSMYVDAIRCGIAGGSVCSTKTETGVLTPMWSMLQEIRQWKDEHGSYSLIIADGSIKQPQHLCKALCFADIAMAGGIFAGTEEAPGNVIKTSDNQMVKLYRGAASFSTQKYEAKKHPKYVEGIETFIPYTGSLKKVVDRYTGGLQSSMSYMNARTLSEYRKNFDYTIVKG